MAKQNQNPSNVRGGTDKEREERKTTREREEAGQKGSEKMRKEREHMSDIGKKGGEASHRGKSKEEEGR